MAFKTVREFAEELAGQHRPVLAPVGADYAESMWSGHCPACGGPRQLYIPGTDPAPECRFWKSAKEFGLVDAE